MLYKKTKYLPLFKERDIMIKKNVSTLFVFLILIGAFHVFSFDGVSADSPPMMRSEHSTRPNPPSPPQNLQVIYDGFEAELLEPGETGPYSFNSWTGSFIGPYGDTTPVDIYYPTSLEHAPYPGLALGHGFTMNKNYFTTWGQYYASWGYVIAVPSLQYAKLFTVNHEKCAYEMLATLDLLKDKNNDSQHPIYGLVDVHSLGLTGFSLGAKACILAVQYETLQGKNNVKAVAPMAIAIGNVPDPLPGLYLIDIPVQIQAGENDLIAPPALNSLLIYEGLEDSSTQYFLIQGANHNQYADMNPISGGLGDGQASISRAEQHRIARKYSTSFFNFYLKNQYQYGEYLYGFFADEDVAEGILVFNEFKYVEYDANFTGTDNNLLTWNASVDDIAGLVDSYRIYRSEYQYGPWDENALIDSLIAQSLDFYNYSDVGKGTADEILWWYVVRAVGVNGIEENNTNAVMEANTVPNKPNTPSGPLSGKAGVSYTYTTSTIDADGDDLWYQWDFGDGNVSDWLGPFASGEVASVDYVWLEKGDYSIKVKAKDGFDAESEWSDPLAVTMPLLYNTKLQHFLASLRQLFSHAFAILEYILGI